MDYLRLIADVLEYIEINAARLVTVDELAQRCCLFCYHFQRIFHAVARRTLKDYLDERRMYAAAKALRQTDLIGVDIAF